MVFHGLSNYSVSQVVVTDSSTQRSVRSGVGILALAAIIALLYYGRIFFITVIIASMIAFLLDPLVDLFMRMRMPRGFRQLRGGAPSACCFCTSRVWDCTPNRLFMLGDLPAYSERINEIVDSAAARVDHFEQGIYRTLVPKRFREASPLDASASGTDPEHSRGQARGQAGKSGFRSAGTVASAVQEVCGYGPSRLPLLSLRVEVTSVLFL